MNCKPIKHLLRSCLALLCAFVVAGSAISVGATDVVGLEQKEKELTDELAELKDNLTTLTQEIEELIEQMEQKARDCHVASLELAKAQINESDHYQAMEKRIQFMYEEGSTSLMEIILTADSMADFVNKTEFVSTVTEYDTDMLNELITIRDDVAAKEAKLEEEKAALETTKEELDGKQVSLNELIDTTTVDLDAVQEELVEARRVQAASGGGVYIGAPVTLSEGDLTLYAALLQAEAGSTNGAALLAVATVVMNRLENPRYAPTTVTGIIYQSGQFSPTWNGAMDRILAAGPSQLAYDVANASLNGLRHTSIIGLYSFRSAATTLHTGINIGDNIFF